MITKKILLAFHNGETEKAIVFHLVKDFNLELNIYRARISEKEEGHMVLKIAGTEEAVQKGIDWMISQGVDVSEQQRGVKWDENLCTSCGNCVPHCPPKALSIPDRKTMKVEFLASQCIECLACLSVCPFGACSSAF